jgi:hypothetical protein
MTAMKYLLLFWCFLSLILGILAKDERHPPINTKKSEAYTVVSNSRRERPLQNQFKVRNTKRTRNRIDKDALEELNQDHVPMNTRDVAQGEVLNSNPKRLRVNKDAAPHVHRNDMDMLTNANSHPENLRIDKLKRNDANSNAKMVRAETDATPTDNRNRSPVYRDELARLKSKKIKFTKRTTNRNRPSIEVRNITDELALGNETIRLIYSILGNSSVTRINTTQVHNSIGFYHPSLLEYANDTASYLEDMKLIKNVSLLTNPNNETRVISFALYGTKPKYNLGAIYNVEMAKVYFPGWKCRFYVTNDVLNLTINVLKDLGSEIEYIPPGMGKIGGMFWRFMVADDPTVDRYIIRDVDSRMNARDR